MSMNFTNFGRMTVSSKILVLTGLGLNCEEETFAAYKEAGGNPCLVHTNKLLAGEVNLNDYKLIHFTGGFSFGDHLGAGRVLANRFRYKQTNKISILEHLQNFKDDGGYLFGVCNGFQTLVNLGLLPGNSNQALQSLSLTENLSGRFQVSWHKIKITKNSPISFLAEEDDYEFPIRHAEGRLIVKEDQKDYLENNKLLAMTYEKNPNGSYKSCAGMCDESGQVIGMMPHPENFISHYNHPEWPIRDKTKRPDGLRFFNRLVSHVNK